MNQPLVSVPSRLPAAPASVSGLFLCSPPILFSPLLLGPKERDERNTKGKTGRRVLRPEAQCQLLLLQRRSIQTGRSERHCSGLQPLVANPTGISLFSTDLRPVGLLCDIYALSTVLSLQVCLLSAMYTEGSKSPSLNPPCLVSNVYSR